MKGADGRPEPSPWLLEWLPRLEGPVLDLACGRGRNARAVWAAGLPLLGIDRDPDALRELVAAAPGVLAVRADLEARDVIPLRPGAFGAVLVFRYLHRPLLPAIEALLRPGGWLLYETFTVAQRALGRGPRSPAFLLEPGELRQSFPGLLVEGFEEGLSAGERPEALARLAARRPD